jgi:ATP-dependent DNA ligase
VIVDADGELSVQSRNGYNMTDQFALPVRGLAALGRPMVIDGEIAVPDREGRTHLNWLHDARTRHRPDLLAFFAFDLLYLDGFDLRRCLLEERIALLDQLIPEAGCQRVLSVGYVIGGGAEFFAKASDAGAEGIVSKRLGKPYLAGDSPYWLKAKVNETHRFVVTGFETELGKQHAVHVAEERDGELVPQGRVKHGLRGLLPRLGRFSFLRCDPRRHRSASRRKPGRRFPYYCAAAASLSCVFVSKSLASCRSCSCSEGSPAVRLTMRPRFTAGRA